MEDYLLLSPKHWQYYASFAEILLLAANALSCVDYLENLAKDIVENLIISSLRENGSMSKKELVDLVCQNFPDSTPSSVTWRLHKLKSKGLIQSATYGEYSLDTKQDPQYSVSSSLKRIFNKAKKEYPFLSMCVWDSAWFNTLMLHQQFKHYLVLEVEKDSMESVFNSLTDFSKKVFLNPTDEIFSHYISNFTEVIIVMPLLSEAPVISQNGVVLAPFEKLLVDCLADKNLFASQQGEIDFIFKSAFSKYRINVNKLKRYARRRNQLENVTNLMDKIVAK